MHTSRVAIAVALVVALEISAVDATARAQSAAPDACALFTLEEAGQATGRKFRRARPGTRPGATTCDLLGGTEGTIAIVLSPSASTKDFDDLRKLLIEQGEKPEAVKGVGDDAYWWGARLYLRAGTRHLTIWNGDPSQPEAEVRADILALARLAVPKLK